MGSTPAVQMLDLRKTYTTGTAPVEAVRGITLDVGRGEFFGLLGPNGAGKSTTIGMITTLVRPTSGTATVAGLDVRHDPVGVKRRIGVVSQTNTLDRMLTVEENLEFRARFFGVPAREARTRARELLEVFGLADRAKAMSFAMSGGQARRLMIARALVHRPEVLFLDEPTAALDPQTRVNLWQTLRELHADGQTILLTTHYMQEAEDLCERVAVIDHGSVLACDTVAGLTASAGGDTVITVQYDGPAPTDLPPLPGRVEVSGNQARVFAAAADGVLGELIAAGARSGVGVVDASQLKPSLETAFLALTGREYRE